MAILHATTISPTKDELLGQWVPTQLWGSGMSDVVGAYRFDDPAGEVGVETFVVRTSAGHLVQVPLTYRGAPLPGGEPYLICTMEHGVLGQRWVYDGCGDVVYAATLASAVVAAAAQSELIVQRDGTEQRRERSVVVSSTGVAGADVERVDTVVAVTDPVSTVVAAGALRLVVRRRLDLPAPDVAGHPALYGTWEGQAEPVLLAHAESDGVPPSAVS